MIHYLLVCYQNVFRSAVFLRLLEEIVSDLRENVLFTTIIGALNFFLRTIDVAEVASSYWSFPHSQNDIDGIQATPQG